MLNSVARGLPCRPLSLLALLRCGAVCLALSASMPACAVCACACAVLWYYVRLCLGSWCCASCSCCALCMLCLYVCNIISLYNALLYGYIGYKNRACCRLNIWGVCYLFFVHATILTHLIVQWGADLKNLRILVNTGLAGYISLKTMQRSVVFPPSFQIVME